jgi:hypothetical protein
MIAALFIGPLIFSSCGTREDGEEAIEEAWEDSSHADSEARAFTRWNDDDPPEIPENCAKCHSTPGYHDFLGVDGSTPGKVDKPAPVGTTVECEACHNEVSSEKDAAVMPSNIELAGLGSNSNCFECHQGRASSVQVDEAIDGMPPDTVNAEIRAPSVHNNPAGPYQYGTLAKGGYEYGSKEYASRYDHVVEFDTCISCHDAHSLRIDAQRCGACHLSVNSADDFSKIRSGNIDYDGDGDVTEGIESEIDTLEEKLLEAIDKYVAETNGVEPLVIGSRFVNEEGDTYSTWTPHLLQAAYNYQFSTVGAGGYAHNPHYVIQLLYDSIEEIGGSMSGLSRPEVSG